MPTPADSSADAAATNSPPAAPDTIVLIHGFWVTPRSWEHWIPYYEARGYRVLAPAYPGLEVEVEALNRDPTPIERLTVPQIVDHLERVVRGVASPPILMGHSAGGVFVQVLLDHGFGAAGVTMNSAPTEGVAVVPWTRRSALYSDSRPIPAMNSRLSARSLRSSFQMLGAASACWVAALTVGSGSPLRRTPASSTTWAAPWRMIW